MATGEADRPGLRVARILAAWVAYLLAALLLFGDPLLFHLADYHAGSGPDPQFMLWSVAWWPFALTHRISPLFCKLVWAPQGFDVLWSTSMGLQSILAAPLTLHWGPVVSLNLLALAMPSLTALAGFALAYRIIGKRWPALLGGYLYGFSPFIVGHQAGAHIALTASFMIPLTILLTLGWIDGRIGAVSYILILTAMLACQFLLGLELLGTMVFFGAIALAVAWLVWRERRRLMQRLGLLIGASLILTAIVLGPLLFHVMRVSGMGRHRVWSDHGADLFELLVPGRFFLLGSLSGKAGAVSYQHFTRDVGGYVGLPILLLAGFYFYQHASERRARFLGGLLAVIYVTALGPSLHWRGIDLGPLPWKLFDKIPLINSAQAVRFMIYVQLILALVAALWFAETRMSRWGRLLVAAILIVAILPNVRDRSLWAADLDTPAFFTGPAVRAKLHPGEIVLLLPFSANGQGMTWQALSGMYFAIAGGWTGPTPASFAAWPIMAMFNHGAAVPQADRQLLAFLGAHQVTAVIIDQRAPLAARWVALLNSRETQIERIDGVILVRPSPSVLARYKNATAAAMRLPAYLARDAGEGR